MKLTDEQIAAMTPEQREQSIKITSKQPEKFGNQYAESSILANVTNGIWKLVE